MSYTPRTDTDARYVKKPGDTMTGDLTIDKAGDTRTYYRAANGSKRWAVGKTGDAESGGNAGSRFAITAFDDSGNQLGDLMFSDRTTGVCTYPFGINVGSSPIRQVANPTAVMDGVNKQYVDLQRWTIMQLTNNSSYINAGSVYLTTDGYLAQIEFRGAQMAQAATSGVTLVTGIPAAYRPTVDRWIIMMAGTGSPAGKFLFSVTSTGTITARGGEFPPSGMTVYGSATYIIA